MLPSQPIYRNIIEGFNGETDHQDDDVRYPTNAFDRERYALGRGYISDLETDIVRLDPTLMRPIYSRSKRHRDDRV